MTPIIMTTEAIIPVNMNIKSIEKIIFPNRPTLVMLATDEEIEKKTSGIIAVNKRFRKISPKGFKTAASCLKIIPSSVPIKREIIKVMEKP